MAATTCSKPTRSRPPRGLPHVTTEERGAREQAMEMLEFLGLTAPWDNVVRGLPVRPCKAWRLPERSVGKPRLLLLDEPAGGLNHEEVTRLGDEIREIRDRFNLTILLVEHHMALVCASPTRSPCSTSDGASRSAHLPRCRLTRRSSRPISEAE